MPMQNRTSGILLVATLALSMSLLAGTTAAQTSGNNAVSSGAGTIASTAFIDASAFYGSSIGGTNICAIINYVYNNVSLGNGAVIDARGIAIGSSHPCTVNPWNAVSSSVAPTTLLLPGGTIYINTQWTVPSGTHVIGEGRSTILSLASTWTAPTNNYMIQMGPSTCPGGAPVVLEQLSFQPASSNAGDNINGIDNECSGALSYVDHIVFLWLSGVGIHVGSGAAGSGPYTNINYAAGDYCENQGIGTVCPSQCVNLQGATRGVHGITCTMASTTSNFRTDEAAIHLDAANSIEDTHFEGFYDGIVVGDTASAAGSSLLHLTSGNGGSSSGPVINTVHICNPASLSGACTNYGGSSTADLGDITISQVTNNTNVGVLIKDDVTSTNIGVPPGSSVEYVTGLYSLGQIVAGASATLGYTRLNSSAATSTSPVAGAPIWATASSTTPATPCPIGSMFSNTGGTSKTNTIYVCESNGSGGTEWNAVN